MGKVRLMRVYNRHTSRMNWVPRKLWETGFKTSNLLKEPEWIIQAVKLAEMYNAAERRRLKRESV